MSDITRRFWEGHLTWQNVERLADDIRKTIGERKFDYRKYLNEDVNPVDVAVNLVLKREGDRQGVHYYVSQTSAHTAFMEITGQNPHLEYRRHFCLTSILNDGEEDKRYRDGAYLQIAPMCITARQRDREGNLSTFELYIKD